MAANEKAIFIAVKDTEANDYVLVPVVPESVVAAGGDPINETVQVIDLGDVDFLKGTTLRTVSWESFFPERYDASYCKTSDLKEVTEYAALFTEWKEKGTKLRLVVSGMGISDYYKVAEFEQEIAGPEGDIFYSVLFKQYRTTEPVQVSTGADVPRTTATVAARTPTPVEPPGDTYTVIPGDYLVRIGKKVKKPWREIYERNKAIIGSNPNVIQVGQVFTI